MAGILMAECNRDEYIAIGEMISYDKFGKEVYDIKTGGLVSLRV